MRTFHTMTAGIGLAVGAAGLMALSTPAFASNPVFNWFIVTGGCPASGSSCTTPGITPGQVPLYAEQTWNVAHINGTSVVIPGHAVSTPTEVNSLTGGLTYEDSTFQPQSGVLGAVATFTYPPGDKIICTGANKPTTPWVDGVYFRSATLQSCTPGNGVIGAGQTLAVLQYQLNLNSTSPSGQAWFQLGNVAIDGTSSFALGTGIQTLANYTANPGPSGGPVFNCDPTTSLGVPCDVNVVITDANGQTLPNFGGGNMGADMAESGNDLSLLTSSADKPCICIDLADNPINPGETFQQPCDSGSSADTYVADKGFIDIDEEYYLAADGVSIYQWLGGTGSLATGVITLTGTCGGLEQNEDIGSSPASCGIRPFTGETVYLNQVLIGVSAEGNDDHFDPTRFCPKPVHDEIQGIVNNVTGGAAATFSPVVLPNALNSTTPGIGDVYYEVCEYASGNAVLGPVGQWTVSLSVDCANPVAGTAGFADCTTLTEGVNGQDTHSVNQWSTQPQLNGDQLLTYEYNGKITWINFTNGGFGDIAYLRLVSLMHDTIISSTGTCVALDPDQVCEPYGQVICKVWGDDGQNGFATLYTGDSTNPGLLTGTNALIPVNVIFANAGIVARGSNPYDLGAMLCFSPYKVYIQQVWSEPNGTIVNIK